MDLQGPTLARYLGKVPWQGGTWPFDLAFTIRLAICHCRARAGRSGVGSGGPAVPLAPAQAGTGGLKLRCQWPRFRTASEDSEPRAESLTRSLSLTASGSPLLVVNSDSESLSLMSRCEPRRNFRRRAGRVAACKRNVPLNHFTKWPRAATW